MVGRLFQGDLDLFRSGQVADDHVASGELVVGHDHREVGPLPGGLAQVLREAAQLQRQHRAQTGASRNLPRDRGLVLHLPSAADGARGPQRRVRGARRNPR